MGQDYQPSEEASAPGRETSATAPGPGASAKASLETSGAIANYSTAVTGPVARYNCVKPTARLAWAALGMMDDPEPRSTRQVLERRQRRATDSKATLRSTPNLDSAPARIAIIVKDPIVRTGLKAAISLYCDVTVVVEAQNRAAASAVSDLATIDLAILDFASENVHEAVRALKALTPPPRILVRRPALSDFELNQLARSGVMDMIAENASIPEFMRAIALTLDRGAPGAPRARRAAQTMAPRSDASLSAREVDVLLAIAAGFSNKEIANKLDISVRTVETHRLNLRRKTGIMSARDLAKFAGRQGLSPDDEEEGDTIQAEAS